MKPYTYIFQSVIGHEKPTTVTCFSYDNLMDIMREHDNKMKDMGYRRIRQTRKTFGSIFMTNITIYYQKV